MAATPMTPTDPLEAALPVGAYVAAALQAANYGGDSGEDVDRFLDELAKRGHQVISDAVLEQAFATPRPVGVDEQTLVLAWLNAMHPEHNAGCNEQGAFDCPVAAEVREFVPKVAREYAALTDSEERTDD